MISEAVLAQEQAAEGEFRARWEREQFPRWRDATDAVLYELEELNLRGVQRAPKTAREWATEKLIELPLEARGVLKLYANVTVQAALDSVFAAQEVLFCLRDPARDVGGEESEGSTADGLLTPYDATDLDRWAGICRWLDSFGPQGLSKSVTPEKWADDLEAMRGLGLVFIRDRRLWWLHREWAARLAKLRARLEVG